MIRRGRYSECSYVNNERGAPGISRHGVGVARFGATKAADAVIHGVKASTQP